MTRVLHLSDTHFGTQRPAVVEAVRRLAERERPDLVVLSGDVTQRARRRQFAAAAAFMDQLAPPGGPARLVVPGNHDIPLFNLVARALWPYRGFKRAFGPELEPLHDAPGLLAIGLNTTRAHRHKHGEISATQIERVARRLRAARAGQLRLVVLHHPMQVTGEQDVVNLLRGHEAAAHAWAEAGADLLLGGHIHLPYVRPLNERLDGLAQSPWVVQAGTAVSRRVRGGIPNSVNLIRHAREDAPHCEVERWDYDASAGAFGPVECTRIELQRRGQG